jgi:hypothetical protein
MQLMERLQAQTALSSRVDQPQLPAYLKVRWASHASKSTPGATAQQVSNSSRSSFQAGRRGQRTSTGDTRASIEAVWRAA